MVRKLLLKAQYNLGAVRPDTDLRDMAAALRTGRKNAKKRAVVAWLGAAVLLHRLW